MKNSNLKFKILFSLIFIIVFLGISAVVSKDKDERIELIKQNQMKNIKMLYKFVMHDFKLAADARYERIHNDKKILDIFQEASRLPLDKQTSLRHELYEYLLPMFLRLRYVGLTNLHFVFENNITFLRMHKPNKFGDDLSRYRYTFKFVNNFREPISGYEQGRTKHGFRFVYPVFSRRGYYIGAVDFTFSSLYMQRVLSDSLGIHSHFLIDRRVFSKKAWKDGDVGYDYETSEESKDYLSVSNDKVEMPPRYSFHAKIPKQIKKEIQKKLKSGDDFSICTLEEKNAVLMTFISIKNVKEKKTVAYLVTYRKNRTIYDIVDRYRFFLVALFIILAVIFYFLYKLVMQKNTLENEVEKQVRYIRKLHASYDENIIASSIDLEGNITYVSEAFCSLLGYDKSELTGKSHDIISYRGAEKNSHRKLYLAISNNKTWRGNLKIVGKDRRTHWFDTVVSPLYDQREKKIGYSVIGHDITDRKSLEKLNSTLEERISQEVENIREKEKQLLQQSRLAQMGEMLSMIAHQWRQPLTAISSASSAIVIKSKLKKLDLETSVGLANKISGYVQHLSLTIDDFRDFFKPDKEEKIVTYADMVESILNIVEDSMTNKGIELIKNFKCECELKTYPNEIKQVILNLVKNAEDILAEKQVEKPYIEISTYEKSDMAILRVCDNAGGVPEEIIDSIFDPYFSTKTKKDGTGLGLYMSKIIVEEHCGGKLNVFNSKEGAVFEIVLHRNR